MAVNDLKGSGADTPQSGLDAEWERVVNQTDRVERQLEQMSERFHTVMSEHSPQDCSVKELAAPVCVMAEKWRVVWLKLESIADCMEVMVNRCQI